jgi:DNA-binding MarR family transcriptional regulator
MDAAATRQRGRTLYVAATQLLALARDIEQEARREEQHAVASSAFQFDRPDAAYAEVARQSYRARRWRNAFFGDSELFGEPAWDLLLELFVAASEQRLVSVTSASIAAAVPQSTALRWIALLEKDGLVLREPDPWDKRRDWLRLTADGLSRMLAYLQKTFPTLSAPDWTLGNLGKVEA